MRGTAWLSTLAVLLLASCGGNNFQPMPSMGCFSVAPSSPASRGDEAWATNAFARYGEAAVETCLNAFRQDVANGAVDVDARGEPVHYRENLAAFMCECARGQSTEPCPDALTQ